MALTGTAEGQVCYTSNALAVDAYFQSVVPVISGSTTYSYQKNSGVWYLVADKLTGSGIVSSSSVASVPTLAACDPYAGFNDGIALGGLLTIAMVSSVIYGIVSKAK